ncbi:MAG: hypothetical protein NUV97_02015 [archaeon]|nr:hypothetical protein [archaeon]MCR4323727.1 hypothetical protein [Nanoarchaeota archaeon]
MKNRGNEILLFIALVVVFIGLILFYSDKVSVGEVNNFVDEGSIALRFNTSEPHWDHMPLTYNWNEECGEWNGNFTNKIRTALQEISNVTEGVITFEKLSLIEPDIMFICDASQYYSKGLIIAEAESFSYGNIFAPSKVYIYGSGECKNRPTTIIHEVLHLFGIGHTEKTEENLQDIMFEKKYDCKAYISNETIDYLKGIYN